jgi:hypothetical protein
MKTKPELPPKLLALLSQATSCVLQDAMGMDVDETGEYEREAVYGHLLAVAKQAFAIGQKGVRP